MSQGGPPRPARVYQDSDSSSEKSEHSKSYSDRDGDTDSDDAKVKEAKRKAEAKSKNKSKHKKSPVKTEKRSGNPLKGMGDSTDDLLLTSSSHESDANSDDLRTAHAKKEKRAKKRKNGAGDTSEMSAKRQKSRSPSLEIVVPEHVMAAALNEVTR